MTDNPNNDETPKPPQRFFLEVSYEDLGLLSSALSIGICGIAGDILGCIESRRTFNNNMAAVGADTYNKLQERIAATCRAMGFEPSIHNV